MTRPRLTRVGTAAFAAAAVIVAGWTLTVEKRKLDQPLKVHDADVTEAVGNSPGPLPRTR
jgi:hypothetical protein